MRRLPSLASPVLAAALLLAVLPSDAGAAGAAGAADVADAATSARPAGDPAAPGTVVGTDGVPQTSDGVVGRTAPRGTVRPRSSRAAADETVRAAWQVAPGVQARVWDQQTPRGPVRLQLLSVDWRTPGLSLDQANPGKVARVGTVSDIARRDGAVAAVNGDFFDIGDTGAPLGLGKDRQRGLLHGRSAGWNSTFYVGGGGRPDIGTLPVRATIVQRPRLQLTNVNSPSVTPGGIGVYTADWGSRVGLRVTDGIKSGARVVVIRKGRVVRNTTKLAGVPVRHGKVLVGRGAGARALVSLKRRTKVTVRTSLDVKPQMAITGNAFLLDEGVSQVVDDREMHPRTAIGIDRDTHQVLMLVVDGRQSFSRGYTMVELARTMRDLGAEDALNLDGGGSSTMLAKRGGAVQTVNSPSDGFQRRVANAVEVLYRAP